MTPVIDCDQHLFEPRDLWSDYADPSGRDKAIRMQDDALGHTHLVWDGRRMGVAHVTLPGDTEAVGRYLAEVRAGRPARAHYDELVPPAYSVPAERLTVLDRMRLDEAVLFPNYGLLWEHVLRDDLDAVRVNMGAWNRFAIDVAAEGKGRLHPVAHLTLRDPSPDRAWLESQLAALSAAGVRLAMLGPGLVDGKPLSHPELDRAWAAFVAHGISPVFHVANVERPFADAWYTDAHPDEPGATDATQAERTDLVLSSVFLWTGVALGLADLTINGVLHRHPDLRLGIMELSAPWLPMFLMYLDGGIEFTTRLNGRARFAYAMKPSEYVRSHVRIAGFSYERPDRLVRRVGDLFMACSDWPHTEGSAHPLEDYRKLGGEDCTPAAAPGLFGDNLAWLLRR
jgi:hypothetical protein